MLHQLREKCLRVILICFTLINSSLYIHLGCNKDQSLSSTIFLKDLVKVKVFGLFNPKNVIIKFDKYPIKLIINSNNRNETLTIDSHFNIKHEDGFYYLQYHDKLFSFTNIVVLTQNDNLFYNRFAILIPDKISRYYRGGLEINSDSKNLHLLVSQNIEDLVCASLSSESNDDQSEYLKALAIIIRTYIVKNINRHKTEGFDFCDNTHCQLFFGEDKNSNAYKRAARSTENIILSYNDLPVDVFYCGSCGGKTISPKKVWENYLSFFPYKEIKCIYCTDSKYNHWTEKIDKKTLNDLFFYPTSQKYFSISAIYNSDSLPEKILLKNKNTENTISSDDFRIIVGRNFGWNKILSNNFRIKEDAIKSNEITIDGNGFGHCVGFCQSGAEEMSRQGKTCEEIIAYYFEGSNIKKIK